MTTKRERDHQDIVSAQHIERGNRAGEPDKAKGAYSMAATDACPGGEEAHVAHLNMNGECPWCGAYTDALARQIKLPSWYVGCTY